MLQFILAFQGDFWHSVFRTNHSKAPKSSVPKFVNAELGLQDSNGTLVCFGDFNSDTFTDVIVLLPDGNTIVPYLWDEESFRFSRSQAGSITAIGIASVAAADFNYDGKLDLLVQTKNSSLSPPSISAHIYYGNPSTGTFELSSTVITSLSPLLIIEADGNLRPDLFGVDYNSEKRGIWLNGDEGWSFHAQVNAKNPTQALGRIAQQSAFVDVDGDCFADLITVACLNNDSQSCSHPSLQVWLHSGKAPSLSSPIAFDELTREWSNLPSGVRQISFADFDSDGASDLLLVVCTTPSCSNAYIAIAYAKLKPLCDSFIPISSSDCRPLGDLCSADSSWDFPGLSTFSSGEFYVVLNSSQSGVAFSLGGDQTVRIGDYDIDGYPDIIAPLVNGAILWHNRPCESSTCAEAAVASSRRTFAPDLTSIEMTNLQNVESVAFLDLGEKGSLDILMVSKPPVGFSKPATLYNNLNLDAFFLKTLGLNGICAAWCPNGKRFPEKPYGGIQVGGNFIFSTTRSSGKRHLVQATALSQAGVVSLQTPYVFFGLGRTNNYVEMLYYGLPLRATSNYRYWTPVMPNAQVYIVPYPPSDPSLWSMDSFISPADYVGWVFVAFAVALIVNGVIVLFFRAREMREDENEKKASAHLFSFDIL